ncbi:MAG: endonuclease III domain-containing protein [Lentisphaeria bacterium]|nr:endonuclease III domain-containing protein [Lentisphaeria bacterium]
MTTDEGPGYHPGDFTFPRTPRQRFEICVGCVLTQNTQWSNAEKAISHLARSGNLTPRAVERISSTDLGALIRPSGYFNQKQKKLKTLARFFRENKQAVPRRDQLLALWGIGPETADSIRLYAFEQLEMVIDAYTLRILTRHNFIPPGTSYHAAKSFCARELPGDVSVYQEFHALMVVHGKKT